MAAMSEEEHSLQESEDGITILESAHLGTVDSARVPATIDVAPEASVHGLSVNVNLVVGDSVGPSELASVRGTGLDEELPSVARIENVDRPLEDNRARKKVISQQNAALLAGAAALGGYLTNSLLTWHSASNQQVKYAQEHEKLANRIRTLEEALSLPSVIDVDTTPISQASDSTCVSGTRLFAPPSVSASQAVPVGLCTLLAGRYIARKIQCYRNTLALAAETVVRANTEKDEALAQANREKDEAIARANEEVVGANTAMDAAVTRANEAVTNATTVMDAAIARANEAVTNATTEKYEALARAKEAVARANTEKDEALARANREKDEAIARANEEVVGASTAMDAAVTRANEAVTNATTEKYEALARANEAVARATTEKYEALARASEVVVRANTARDAAIARANEAREELAARDAAIARANEGREELAARDQEIAQRSNALAVALRAVTFGAQEWKKYFGEVGEAPPLPSDMGTILDGPCPFWPDKKVRDTHLLVLIPATVGGVPFTLNQLGELIKRPKNGGHRTEYRFYSGCVKAQIGEQSPPRSYWLLMTRDVLPDSRNKTYDAQKALVAAHVSKLGLPYEMPHALEAAAAILLHHAREGEQLFGDHPWTFTRCQEKVGENQYRVVVGGFSSGGLNVISNHYCSVSYCSGVSCLRKF